MRFLLLCLLFHWLAARVVADDNWPEFRGPHANGHADAADLPLTWSETENVRWKTPIHGRGWSSPVIWDNQIWLTTATEDGKEMFAICVDRETGAIVHDIKLFDVEKPREIHFTNTYASPTPAIEAGRVYLHFGSYGTACVDTAAAQVVWTRRDLPCNHWRGPGSSPILFGDFLVIHYDGYDHQYVVALNKRTGETVWKSDRNVDYGTNNGDFMKAYATPLVIDVRGKLQLISPTSKAVLAYDPLTGEEIWKVRYRGFSTANRPLYGNGMLYVNTGFSKAQLYAIRPDGQGDVTDSHVVWIASKSVPSNPSQLLVDDLIFMVHDGGVATCLDALTGDIIWRKRIQGKYSSSPLYADGRIYFMSHEGKTTVIAPSREYQVLAVNYLGDEPDDGFRASPAAVGRALYLRTKTHLYRIEK